MKGFEPPASRATTWRSNQLSYTHQKRIVVRRKGFEPPTHALEGRCSIQLSYRRIYGAGDGNRTHTTSLEGWDSTIELHPQNSKPTIAILLHFSQKVKRLFQFFPPRLPRSRKTKPEQLQSKTYREAPYPRCLHIIKQIQRYVKHFHQKN